MKDFDKARDHAKRRTRELLIELEIERDETYRRMVENAEQARRSREAKNPARKMPRGIWRTVDEAQ